MSLLNNFTSAYSTLKIKCTKSTLTALAVKLKLVAAPTNNLVLADVQSRETATNDDAHKFQVLEDDFNVFLAQTSASYLVSFLAVIYGLENNIGMMNCWSDWLICGIVWWLGVVYWFSDLEEDTDEGEITGDIVKNILFAVLMFISSEALFFIGFFWGFFHVSLNPSNELGAAWPPMHMYNANYLFAPMLNSLLLLSSGISATLAHVYSNEMFLSDAIDADIASNEPYKNRRKFAKVAKVYVAADWVDSLIYRSQRIRRTAQRRNITEVLLDDATTVKSIIDSKEYTAVLSASRSRTAGWLLLDTLFRGAAFMGVQVYEYTEAPFTIAENSFGTVFFMITGLHGLHVGLGLLALSLCAVTLFSQPEFYIHWENRTGLLAAIWYWHFVDVVWLFVLLFLYYDIPQHEVFFRVYNPADALVPTVRVFAKVVDVE